MLILPCSGRSLKACSGYPDTNPYTWRCTSALLAQWTHWLPLAIPKTLVHHSLQELLHIHHNEVHLQQPTMSSGFSFNSTLKPEELKYKFVLLLEENCLLLETQCWTYWLLALPLCAYSYAPYIRFLSYWWVFWGKGIEKVEHISLDSFFIWLYPSKYTKQQVLNGLSLQAIFTLKLSPNGPN